MLEGDPDALVKGKRLAGLDETLGAGGSERKEQNGKESEGTGGPRKDLFPLENSDGPPSFQPARDRCGPPRRPPGPLQGPTLSISRSMPIRAQVTNPLPVSISRGRRPLDGFDASCHAGMNPEKADGRACKKEHPEHGPEVRTASLGAYRSNLKTAWNSGAFLID
jgi:hypothetical protein